MPNIELSGKQQLSTFRRIALGTWRTAKDPSVYGSITLKMDEALRYIEAFRRIKKKRVTVSHLMARAMADVLEKAPQANAILRLGRLYQRKEIGVFFQVAMSEQDGQDDLSGMTVYRANTKTLEQIVDEFDLQVQKVRSRQDKVLEKTRGSFRLLPVWSVGWVLNLIHYLTCTWNLDLSWAGIPKDPFGSVMITNIGSLGLEEAYVPLVPYSGVPLLLALGSVRSEPLVEADEIKIRKVMRVYATFDHRVLDGLHAAKMVKILHAWFERPFEHFDPLEEG